MKRSVSCWGDGNVVEVSGGDGGGFKEWREDGGQRLEIRICNLRK
jgi:hypothetical protein